MLSGIEPENPTEPSEHRLPSDRERVEDTPSIQEPIELTSEQTPAKNVPLAHLPPPKKRFLPEKIFPIKLRTKLGRAARPLSITAIVLFCVCITGTVYAVTSSLSKHSVAPSKAPYHAPAFKLVNTIPSDGASDINISTSITLNFSQAVDASKLAGNLFFTPTVNGTFKQGSSAKQAVFTPDKPFAKGSKVSLMLNSSYQSMSGAKIGTTYVGSFTTSIPNDAVEFQDQNGFFDQVASLPSGKKESFTVYVGSDVGSSVSIALYKGKMNDLLNSLIYQKSATAADSFTDFSAPSAGLSLVSTSTNITDNKIFEVQQPDGLYLAVASDATGKRVGLVWVNFTTLGVLARQDDQRTVLDAQSLTTGQDEKATIATYSLNTALRQLSTQTVSGLTTLQTPYRASPDLAIASAGSELAIVPFNVINSGGDIRVDQDLSAAKTVYGVTDLPTYRAGSSVRFAGFARSDNDALYSNPAGGMVSLYVPSLNGGTPLYSFDAPISSDGVITASIPTDASWLTGGDSYDGYQLYAKSTSGNGFQRLDQQIASFTLANQTSSTTRMQVRFSQASYMPGDPITATIKATDTHDQPLANKSLQVHVYSQDYYENDASSNLSSFGATGTEIPGSPFTLTTDTKGLATYVPASSSLPNDGLSQQLTLSVNAIGEKGVGAAGGDTTLIHQARLVLGIGVDRTYLPKGQDMTSHVYVTTLDGSAAPDQTVSYKLDNYRSTSTITTGSATTDSKGMATITIPASNLTTDSVSLDASVTDSTGNTTTESQSYGISADTNSVNDTSGAVLLDLNANGVSPNLQVGQQVSLHVSSPAALQALETFDRGRIYSPSIVDLAQGDNVVNFTVTPQMAPSFTLTFSYFRDGVYHSEGILFNVSNRAVSGSVSIHPQSQIIRANQPTTFSLNSRDYSGAGLASSMLVSVVSTDTYGLSNMIVPPISSAFYASRPIMTSSTSSLSPVGSGGGRCGGGGIGTPDFTNPVGTSLLWQPNLVTSDSGAASVTLTPTAGSWTMNVYSMSGSAVVGSQSTTFSAN